MTTTALEKIRSQHFALREHFAVEEEDGYFSEVLRDSYPNKWFIEATSGVDRAIHECFYTPETLQRLLGSQEPTSENAPADVAATAGTAGSYQIGEVQARSWMVFGRAGSSHPAGRSSSGADRHWNVL